MANTGLVWTRCLIRHHGGNTSISREEILDADLALLTTPKRLLAITGFEEELSAQFFSDAQMMLLNKNALNIMSKL